MERDGAQTSCDDVMMQGQRLELSFAIFNYRLP